MASFDIAFEFMLPHEGGYVNNPKDLGGATKYGISSRFLRNHSITMDVSELSLAEAKAMYETYFWQPNRYEDIVCQQVANKLLDLAVNMGAPRANKFAQIACSVTPDGIVGDMTIAAINAANSSKLMEQLITQACLYYRNLVENNPEQDIFLKGWLNRARA